jgi:DivIVA domain-containing protein
MSKTDPPRTRINPSDVRRKNFTVRLRGLDQNEVRFFMAGLADDVEGLQTQLTTLTLEMIRAAPSSRSLRQMRWIRSPTRL